MKKLLNFIAEIGTIMYVGGILSHIVIGAINPHPTPEAAELIYTYKSQSAYILILPGLGLKVLIDLILFLWFGERAWWMRIKLAMMAFLTVNAFVFMLPIIPQVLELARASIPKGELGAAFHALEAKEQMVGMSNIIPLLTEMVMGAFKPCITKAERQR